jgi:hypothetical protein
MSVVELHTIEGRSASEDRDPDRHRNLVANPASERTVDGETLALSARIAFDGETSLRATARLSRGVPSGR